MSERMTGLKKRERDQLNARLAEAFRLIVEHQLTVEHGAGGWRAGWMAKDTFHRTEYRADPAYAIAEAALTIREAMKAGAGEKGNA